MHYTTKKPQGATPSAIYSSRASTHIDELMQLYQQYVYSYELRKILTRKIKEANIAIQRFINERDNNSFVLFATINYDESIDFCTELHKKSEFFIAALSFVYKKTHDRNLRDLLGTSIDIVNNFLLKITEYKSVYEELKCFNEEIDENSDAYQTKMQQIVELISEKNSVSKSANSIRELLAV